MATEKKTTVENVDELVELVKKHREELSKVQELAEGLLGDIEEAVYSLENAASELAEYQSAMQGAAKNAVRSIQDANDYLRRTV